MPGKLLVVIGELLFLSVRQPLGPPDTGEDVVSSSAQRFARIGLRTARAVADHLMMHPVLKILPVHGDVVGEMGIGKEDVCSGALHLLQQAGEIWRSQLELFVEHYGEIAGMLLSPFFNAVSVIYAMISVLHGNGNLQAFL